LLWQIVMQAPAGCQICVRPEPLIFTDFWVAWGVSQSTSTAPFMSSVPAALETKGSPTSYTQPACPIWGQSPKRCAWRPLWHKRFDIMNLTAHAKAMGVHRYRNYCDRMVILRCIGPNTFFQEKVVFPLEDWLFDCPPESRVDIWSHGLTGVKLLDSISADDLQIADELVAPPGRELAQKNLNAPNCDLQSGTSVSPLTRMLVPS
jgi:hypothetical protein